MPGQVRRREDFDAGGVLEQSEKLGRVGVDGGKEGRAILAEPASFHQLRIELLREGQVFVDDLHQVAAASGCFGDVRGRNQDTDSCRFSLILRAKYVFHFVFNFYYLIKFRILILTLKLI